MHLLCLEYQVPLSRERFRVLDSGPFDAEQYCRGPRAWHGIVSELTATTWTPTTWLPDLCEGEVRQGTVLAVAGKTPMVAYCAPGVGGGCTWRISLLKAGYESRPLHTSSGQPETMPVGFFTRDETLNAVVMKEDPSGTYQFVYALVSLDRQNRLRRTQLPPRDTVNAEPVWFPRRSLGADFAATSWTSTRPRELSILLPLAPFDQTALDWASIGQRVTIGNASSPTGVRAHEASILPLDDGETQSAQIKLRDGTKVELEGRTVDWLRATCAASCVAIFRYHSLEQSPTERYPGSLYVLRTGAGGALRLLEGTVCSSTRSGELMCAQRD
jgi:hypothetical protein